VCPADHAVPPKRRHVFVDDCQTAVAQHSAYLVQHEASILRVMQHIAKQHCIETLIPHGKVAAVVRQVIDMRGGAAADVETDDSGSQNAL
jgi:hypothetical protein